MPPAPPTAQEVEALALLHAGKEKKVTDAAKALKTAKEELAPIEKQCIDLVSKFGSQHAKKSKLLYGLKWEMMATFGRSTSVDAAAVERLRQKLVENDDGGLLRRFFTKTFSWTLLSTARQEVLQPDISDEVRALFAVCEVTADSTPKLEVREQKKSAASA